MILCVLLYENFHPYYTREPTYCQMLNKIVRQSLIDDLEGEKRTCWDTEILQDDDREFTYEISRCLYFDTCKEHGYQEFCKVFCTHDWYASGGAEASCKIYQKVYHCRRWYCMSRYDKENKIILKNVTRILYLVDFLYHQ